jgi:hypothetical protein
MVEARHFLELLVASELWQNAKSLIYVMPLEEVVTFFDNIQLVDVDNVHPYLDRFIVCSNLLQYIVKFVVMLN